MSGETAAPGRVTIALPSKGALADPTLDFLRSCDLKVAKPNPRQYVATIPALALLDVLFQRVNDIAYKVADGTVDLGITGRDVVEELAGDDDVIVLHDDLGYGDCDLVLAVPEAWIDVETMTDVADIALDFREGRRRNLRVATKFTTLARQFLHAHGIHHFTLVEAEGAIEAAPTLGYADIIVDLSATGTTLRENHLKPVSDGVLLQSTACLVGNARRLREAPEVLDTAHTLLEVFDATLQGQNYYQVSANIRGETPEAVAEKVASHPVTRGLQGPTVASIYSSRTEEGARWYNVTVIVHRKQIMAAVAHFRSIGGTQTTVIPVRYIFMEQSPSYQKLLARLGRGK
ncbi:MAG: ATP phosphoribosyltransferase [Anaerolineae bacterium]|nr:ATP phosphoribosyltransferase [Anaerolineae bacterium]